MKPTGIICVVICHVFLFACREFHTKIPLQKNLISKQDTLYILEPYGVVRKKGWSSGYSKTLWNSKKNRFFIGDEGPPYQPDTVKVRVDSLESRILIHDVDSISRAVFSKSDFVMGVSLTKPQSKLVLDEFLKMIEHFRNDTAKDESFSNKLEIVPEYKFSSDIHLDRNKCYGVVYMDWHYYQHDYYTFSTRGGPLWSSPGINITLTTLHFCIIDGRDNRIIFYKYSVANTDYNIGPSSPHEWWYKEGYLQMHLKKNV